MHSEREEGAVTGCRPLPRSGALGQGQPLPGYLFSIYWGQEKSPAWGGSPSSPSSLPCLAPPPPLRLFCATVTRGLEEEQRGQTEPGLRGERAMVEAQGLQGLPTAPFCPPLQMMGVNSSGGQLGRWTGAPGGPLPPRPQPLLGSILLINTGSGTGLWLLSWAGEECLGGVQCTPDPVLPAPPHLPQPPVPTRSLSHVQLPFAHSIV